MGKNILLKIVLDSDSARMFKKLRIKHGPDIESVVLKTIKTQYIIDEELAKSPGRSLFIGMSGGKLREVILPK